MIYQLLEKIFRFPTVYRYADDKILVGWHILIKPYMHPGDMP